MRLEGFIPLAKYFAFLQVMQYVLANAEGFAPAGATKGLSDRPLETFGPMLVGMLARQETVSFLLGVFA